VIDLYDPDTYAIGAPHEVFAELRRSDPIHWQDIPEGTGYWAVLRHADVVHVARTPKLFSASAGGVVLEDLDPEQLAMMQHMLLAMDPPTHDTHRRPLAPTFGARVIGGMERRIRTIVGEILDSVGDGELELVHDVCGLLPSRVVGDVMGLPPDDEPRIRRWAELMTGSQDADVVGADDTTNASIEMAMYAIDLAARRRAEPARDDLTSLLLASTFDGEPMSDVDFGSFFVQLVTAGNDTTRTMLSSGTRALVEHPAELAALRADRSLIPSAVEEILRWANPLHYFRRTATEDTDLSGVRVAAGDKVAMIYTSANRDETVFDDPDRFDVRRGPNPHLSFGIGGHFCLGAHVARLEGRVFFEELLDRFARLEITGDPQRVRSNLNNGLRTLPMRLVRG
jgi:cytochrome P450